ncbi:polygalacturonase-like [Capsicum annuum]|uniref:polygalacturonase-like n=1 Tax=Capsicum annuum TaxID=4072 RepID=UPI001FB116E9|nr:polygalacturonase-like [Capsicum annuum]
MDLKFKFVHFAVVVLFLVQLGESQNATFDITKYGAKSDADISEALLSAFKEACQSTSPSTIVIPKGTFQMNQVKLEGPCKGPLELQIQATLKAPSDPNQLKTGEWLTINKLDGFTMSGGGTLDGQGKAAWECKESKKCTKLPNNLSFNSLTNSIIKDITTLDSKSFHVNVNQCKNLTFLHFNVKAPGDSPNTDGIHISRSSSVNVTESTFSTGDDCISVGDQTEQLSITKVTCGPGHGISVGSLGGNPDEKPVVGVIVKNCTFISTDNGVRIKTWPASHPGVVSDIHFEDIMVQNVSNPIFIDQVYCPSGICNKNLPSQVKISNVTIQNIKGTSRTQNAVSLLCSKGAPCEGVEVGDIDITYSGKEGPATSKCENIKPNLKGKQSPNVCSSAGAPAPAPAPARAASSSS